MSMKIQTLGGVSIESQSGSDVPSAQRLRYALVVYLAVEREVTRDAVVSMFWSDRDRIRGRHSLRQMLYELRQDMGDTWVAVRRDRLIVEADVDVHAFERAAEQGLHDEALRLYRGPFLDGFEVDCRSFEEWAARRRAHLSRLNRRLRREHLARLDEDGDLQGAVLAARDWVAVDRLEDEAAHALIQRLFAAGHRAEALQFFDRYEAALASEFQVQPLEETKDLVGAIRRGAMPQPPANARSRVVAGSHGNEPDPEITANPDRPVVRSGRLPRVLAAAAVVLISATTIFAVARDGVADRQSWDGRTPRIAVLPFEDQSSDGLDAPLARALTSNLVYALAQSSVLQVIPPNGVMLMRAQGTPEDSLGRLLGADYLVGASLSAAGERVRVSVELIDGRTATVLETEVVERPRSDTRSLVDDVVQQAATFLRREVDSQIDLMRVQSHTRSETAWRAVIDAQSIQDGLARLMKQGDFAAVEHDLAVADSLLEAASRYDAAWAEPVALRGWVFERRSFFARVADPRNVARRTALLDTALMFAEEAIRRDDGHSGAHELRGALMHQRALTGNPSGSPGQLDTAESELRAAVRLDPLNQTARRRLAELLHATGSYGAAKNEVEAAYRLDPYTAEANTMVNLLFATSLELGEDDDAEGWCAEGRRRFPNELPFLYCLLALHAWADGIAPDPVLARRALDSFQQAHLRVQPQLRARLDVLIATAHARAGQPEHARALLDSVSGGPPDPALLWMRAGAHVALGETDRAADLMREYLALGQSGAMRIARSRPFWRVRDQPPFTSLPEPSR